MNMGASERRIKNNRIRRRRELRRHMLACIFLLALTISCSFIFFGFRAKAQGSGDEILYKYYKSTVVKSGDTLWDYAEEYGNSEYYDSQKEYIREVIQMNGLENDQIISGQYIILPYYSLEFKS